MQDELSLDKLVSSTNKLSTLTKKLLTLAMVKTPMSVRTKDPIGKKPKKFLFKLRTLLSVPSGSSMSLLEKSP